MPMHSAARALGFSAALVLSLPGMLDAAVSNKLAARGKIILQEKCGRCHAIEATGESPLKIAPQCARSTLGLRLENCRRNSRRGWFPSTRKMPQIDFSDEEVDAILAYLYVLAIRK